MTDSCIKITSLFKPNYVLKLLFGIFIVCSLFKAAVETQDDSFRTIPNRRVCGHDYVKMNKPEILKRRLQVMNIPQQTTSSVEYNVATKANRAFRFVADFTFMDSYTSTETVFAPL